MAPKKAKAKTNPKQAPPPPVEEQKDDPATAERKRIFLQRKAALKWAKLQLESVQLQCSAAEKAEVHWLEEFHSFHEIELIKVVRRLDIEKSLDDVPMEAREQITAYLLQSAKGPSEVDEASFQPMADIWQWTTAGDGPKYERPPVTAEDAAAAELITQWTDTSISGMEALIAVLQNHAASPSVQQIGLIQIGALCPEDGKGDADTDVSGMTSALLVPIIDASMRSHSQDIMVLRGGYAALRGLAMVPKQMPALCDLGGVRVAAEMLKKHFKDEELASTANTAFYVMARHVVPNSPELVEMRAAGVVDALAMVMTHHAWNHALIGKVRLTFPFLTEE